ncbi:MAG: UrcA family protein [Hyphomonas sp.]
MKRSIFAAAAAATLIAMPAFASVETFKLDITYAPEKLETPAGAAAEYTRISEQVSERCAAEHADRGMGRIFATQATRICTAQTLERTVRQIGHPQLTEAHKASRAAG